MFGIRKRKLLSDCMMLGVLFLWAVTGIFMYFSLYYTFVGYNLPNAAEIAMRASDYALNTAFTSLLVVGGYIMVWRFSRGGRV